jgi:hypothetical protein
VNLYFFFEGSNSEAKVFLSRNGKVIVRMRGLPFDATAKEVVSKIYFSFLYIKFFKHFSIKYLKIDNFNFKKTKN